MVTALMVTALLRVRIFLCFWLNVMQFTLSPLMGLIKTQTALPGVLGLGILILTSYLHFLS